MINPIEPPRRQDAKKRNTETRRGGEFNSVFCLAPWRLGGFVSFAFLIAFSLSGCSKQDETGGASAAATKPKYTIGFSQCTVKEPWRVVFNQRLEEAAAKNPEVKLISL